jgi:F420H(2)-dependent quinone reductase
VVNVVHPAEQNGYGFFQEGRLWSMLGMGHLVLLWSGLQMALFLSHQPRNTHLVAWGRQYNSAIATAQKWVTKLHAAVYRATDGGIGGRMMNSPVLLLITTGRKTKIERTTPLLYLRDGAGYAVVASNGGTSGDPTWWLNLRANPEAAVEVGDKRLRVYAEEVEGEEKRRLWMSLVEMYPRYESYQRRTDREIPVVILRPVEGGVGTP